MTEFRIEAAWRATVAATRAGMPLFLPVAAAFVLLPELLVGLYGPPQPKTMAGMTPSVVLIQLVVPTIIGAVAQMTIAKLVIEAAAGTSQPVGNVLRLALLALPMLVGGLLLSAVPVGAGLLLLIVPGLYMLARLTLVLPLVIEERLSPIAALTRSWALTDGHGLRVLGFLAGWALLFALGTIIAGGLGAALASVLTVVGAKALGSFVSLLIAGAAQSVFTVYSGVGSGVLYLQLAGRR